MSEPSTGRTNWSGVFGKLAFQAILIVSTLVAISVIVNSEPEVKGWWRFKTSEMPYNYFVAAAFAVAAVYVFLLVQWRRACEFKFLTSGIAFGVCGVASIFLTYAIHGLVDFFFIREVESGWWIFTTTSQEYYPLIGFLHETAMIAGFTEEPAKFLALMAIPNVRRAIVDRRSGLYYATLCAVGFAFIENISYFSSYGDFMLLRANPAHAVFASIWGAAYGSYVEGKMPLAKLILYFACGMGLHALWNLSCTIGSVAFLIVFTATCYYGIRFIKKELGGPVEPRMEAAFRPGSETQPVSLVK